MKTQKYDKPNISKTAFWDVDFENLDFENNSLFIMDKVFNYGLWADVIAILKYYGLERVKEELILKGLNEDQVEIIETYLTMDGIDISNATNENKLTFLKDFFADSEIGNEGIKELEYLISHLPENTNIYIDPTLARGLNYYTGIIFEAKAPNTVKIGSIGGGGRYDDLTGLFEVPGIPGVGISFGVDRIYDVLTELNLFPETIEAGTTAIFFNMGEVESQFAFGIMQQLRKQGISCELYHEFVKINKQFTYAEKKNISYAIIIGSKEIEQKYCLVKNLKTGIQELVVFEKLFNYFDSIK